MTFCAAITYIFSAAVGSWLETTIIITSSHQHRVSNYNLESALLDVVRVQVGEGFPVIDDSMSDVDMGPSEF